MIVLIAVICICAWLIGAAVKYRLEELKCDTGGSFAAREKKYWGRFDNKASIWSHLAISMVLCLLISYVMQVYIGSWDYLGIQAWRIVIFSIWDGQFLGFAPLLPSSIVGALLYVFHTGKKSGLYRKACWWLIATYPLEKFLTDAVGYGVVRSLSELHSVPKVLPDTAFIEILFVGMVFIVIPYFVISLCLSALAESGVFFGLLYLLRPSRKTVDAVTHKKVHRHKRNRRF